MSKSGIRCAQCAAPIPVDQSDCSICVPAAHATARILHFPTRMPPMACYLTARAAFSLRQWHERHASSDGLLAHFARAKLAGARIMGTDEIAADVATLDSRLAFRMHDGLSDMRTLVHWSGENIVGMTLSIATPMGMALIGRKAGERVSCPDRSGKWRSASLESVAYQPEAAQRAAGRHRKQG